MDAPLHLVPTFLELTQTLNISHAAQKLRQSQPAISRQLRALEEQLGVSLFLRQSRGLVLTHAGRKLKQRLEHPYEIMRETLTSARSESTAIEGPIVFGCLGEIGQKIFAPLLFEFASIHKGITLDIRFMSERLITQGVADGSLGLGMMTRLPEGEALRSHRLFTERTVVLTSTANSLDLEKHSDPQFVAYSAQDPLLYSFLRKHKFKHVPPLTRASIVVNSHGSMLEAIEKMAFYAVMPILSAKGFLDSGRVRIASKKEMLNDIFLVFPDNDFAERRYREVTRFLIMRTRLT